MLVFWGVCFGNVCSELGKWFEKYADSTIQPTTIDIARKGVRPRRFFLSQVLLPMANHNQNKTVFGLQGQRIDSDVRKYHEHTSTDLVPNATSGASPFHILTPYTFSTWARCKEKRTHYVAGNITCMIGIPILGGSNNANAKVEKFPLQSCIVWVRVGNTITPVE